MSNIVSVYATFGSEEEARRIGRQAVERGLAACVNILPAGHSIYRWRGEVAEEEEVFALFKTSAARARELLSHIEAEHGYDVPAAVVWPIDEALADYEAWVRKETSS
ncbi:MAG: divalent-cation tolerance protein CutA [Sphingomonadaceae bacterium]